MYDAVTYTYATRDKAKQICRCIPDEERIKRGRKFGWRRFRAHFPFAGYRMCPDEYGSGALADPADYDWTEIEPGLAGGMLKPGVLERIADDVANDRALAEREAEQSAASAEERNAAAAEAAEQWERKSNLARAQYWLGVADAVGLNPALPPERIENALRVMVNIPALHSIDDYVADMVGAAPEPPELNMIPDEVTQDFDLYMDWIFGQFVTRRER